MTRSNLAPIMVLALLLAACSILYELLAAQTLSNLAGNTVVWYSLVVGLYLASMGIGAFLSEKIGSDSPWRSLVRIELMLSILGALTVPLVHTAHTFYSQQVIQGELTLGLSVFYGTAIPLVLTLGTLTGAELPLLMRLAREVRDETRSANITLGWDYFGSLVGAMLFPLVILPSVNLFTAGFIIAAANLLVALWIIVARLKITRGIAESAVAALLVVGLNTAALKASDINTFFLEKYYYFHRMDGIESWFDHEDTFPAIIEKRSPYQIIHLIKDIQPSFFSDFFALYSEKLDRDPGSPVDYQLFINGAGQTNTRYEEVYHEWFAHMPISMWGKVPESVLVIGAGDGFLLRELLKYDDIQLLDHVDIDPVLIEFAKAHNVLATTNADAFKDPRINTTVTDGYQYLRQTDVSYDAIYVDLPDPNTYDLAKLYSREFYVFLKQRLNPGGFAVFDSSGNAEFSVRDQEDERRPLAENTWPIYSHTLMHAGFETIVPFFSTLERNNPEVLQLVKDKKFRLSPAMEQEIKETIKSPLRRELARRNKLRVIENQMASATSDYLFQGFTFVAAEQIPVSQEFNIPENIDLIVLNEQRYKLSFSDMLVLPDKVDRSKVNSIVRPTLPLTPWWRPMVSF